MLIKVGNKVYTVSTTAIWVIESQGLDTGWIAKAVRNDPKETDPETGNAIHETWVRLTDGVLVIRVSVHHDLAVIRGIFIENTD